MAITSVLPISFKGQESAQTSQKQKGGAGKAVASFFVPGLGEFLDSRNKEGAVFLGSRLTVGVASLAVGRAILANTIKSASGAARPNRTLGVLSNVLKLAALGLTIANTVDAYKGGKDNKVDTQA